MAQPFSFIQSQTNTALVQNGMGGMQVKYGPGEEEANWVDVEPVPGALGLILAIFFRSCRMMNTKVWSTVCWLNPFHEPRISVAVFFNPGARENMYGPLSEILSPDKPPVYQQFTLADFMARFLTKELDGKTLTNYYRL